MNNYRRWIGLMIALTAVFMVGLAPAAADNQSMPPAYDYSGYLFDKINTLRAEHGLPPLVYNFQLEQAAMVQADWMVAHWSYAHFHNGSRPSTRARDAGYSGYTWCCGENTFLSPDPSPDASFGFWMKSKDHYYQMLSKWHTEIGIGFFVGESRTGQVMVFGQRDTGDGGMTPANTTTPVVTEPDPPAQTLDASGCAARHIISAGENLYRIGLSYGVSAETLAATNGITDVTALSIGQELCIPGGGTVSYASNAGTVQNVAVANPADNWCYAGGPWGDGRCDDPDPYVSNHLWECGYYFAHDMHKEDC